VTILLDHGADITVTNRNGRTPLHKACISVIRHRIRDASLETIAVLILAGADTQVRDSKGRLPVEVLGSDDEESRAIYEEAVVEVDSQALKPVLK
jgi:hypothetical protein